MIPLRKKRLFFAFAALSCLPAAAQTSVSTVCNPWKTQVFPDSLSFGQRSCLEFSQLLTPGMFFSSAAFAGYSQWRNSPHMRGNDLDDMAVRLEHIYARRTARVTGEWLIGTLHHEDPRQRLSGKKGVWQRTGAAFLSVVDSPDENGKARMAFAPIAGSLGSGLTSMALYQRQNSIGYALERSGLVYSHYFMRALFREFSPDLWNMAPRFVKKYRPDN